VWESGSVLVLCHIYCDHEYAPQLCREIIVASFHECICTFSTFLEIDYVYKLLILCLNFLNFEHISVLQSLMVYAGMPFWYHGASMCLLAIFQVNLYLPVGFRSYRS